MPCNSFAKSMKKANNTAFAGLPPLDLSEFPPLDLTKGLQLDLSEGPQLDLSEALPLDLTADSWPEIDTADSWPDLNTTNAAETAAGRPETARPGKSSTAGRKARRGQENSQNTMPPGANDREGKKLEKPEAQAHSPAALYAKPQNHFDMFTQEITPETPLVQMTAGQLAEYLNARSTGATAQPGTATAAALAAGAAQPRRYVYGIKGIMQLFGVSNVTAQRYKKGIIKEAVSQNGRIIVVDEEKALQLFKQRKGQE